MTDRQDGSRRLGRVSCIEQVRSRPVRELCQARPGLRASIIRRNDINEPSREFRLVDRAVGGQARPRELLIQT